MRARHIYPALTLTLTLLASSPAFAQEPSTGDEIDALLERGGRDTVAFQRLMVLADRSWREDPARFEDEVMPRLREESLAWYETARMVKIGPEGPSLAEAPPWLELVRHVTFSDVPVDEVMMLAIASSPHSAKLRWFMLERTRKCDEGLATLVGVEGSLPALEMIYVMDGDCRDAGAEALARSSLLGRLRQLYFQRVALGPKGASALAASPHLSSVESLGFNGATIGDDGAAAIVASPNLKGLRVLDLRGVGMTARGALAAALAGAGFLSGLSSSQAVRHRSAPAASVRCAWGRRFMCSSSWSRGIEASASVVSYTGGESSRNRLRCQRAGGACQASRQRRERATSTS